MNGFIPTILVGSVLIVFGLALLWSHYYHWKRNRSDEQIDRKFKEQLKNQFLRRRLASSLIVVAGIYLPVMHGLTLWHKNPIIFTLMVIGLLFLVACIVLIAIADIIGNRFFRGELDLKKAELELKKRSLEQEFSQIKRTQQNGQKT